MAKFLFGLITGVVLCVAGVFLLFFALARSFRESPPTVAQNSVLQLQLSGDIPERPTVAVPFGASAEPAPPERNTRSCNSGFRATSPSARRWKSPSARSRNARPPPSPACG